MSKTAIVVYADPKTGSEEALGRVFNAMFVAKELKDKKQDVKLMFQGTGVRWIEEISNSSHPANSLYEAVADTVVGACRGCADLFGAADGIESAGVALTADIEMPGTSGIIDLSMYLDDGYQILTF